MSTERSSRLGHRNAHRPRRAGLRLPRLSGHRSHQLRPGGISRTWRTTTYLASSPRFSRQRTWTRNSRNSAQTCRGCKGGAVDLRRGLTARCGVYRGASFVGSVASWAQAWSSPAHTFWAQQMGTARTTPSRLCCTTTSASLWRRSPCSVHCLQTPTACSRSQKSTRHSVASMTSPSCAPGCRWIRSCLVELRQTSGRRRIGRPSCSSLPPGVPRKVSELHARHL